MRADMGRAGPSHDGAAANDGSPAMTSEDRGQATRHGDADPAPLATPMAIEGRAGFVDAVHAAIAAAIARDARTMLWVDQDFEAWPLDDPTLIDALAAWLRRPQRRLQLLADDFDALARAHPRFAGWRVDWMHAIDARRPDETMRAALPTLILDDGPVLLRLVQREPARGRAGRDALEAWRARDEIAPVWQHAAAAWPLRPLGL